jgi:urease accessory protein UreF
MIGKLNSAIENLAIAADYQSRRAMQYEGTGRKQDAINAVGRKRSSEERLHKYENMGNRLESMVIALGENEITEMIQKQCQISIKY